MGESQMSRPATDGTLAIKTERRRPAPPGLAFQYNLFTETAEQIEVDVDLDTPSVFPDRDLIDEGISVVKSEEGSHVIVTGFGCWLGKKSERMVVKRGDGKVLYQFPFLRLQEVVVSGRGVSLSTELVSELCARGIRLAFLQHGEGQPYAMLTSPMLTATVETRRAQIMALTDSRGVALARAIVEGKIRNQAKLLKYFGKHAKRAAPPIFTALEAASRTLAAEWRRCRMVQGTSMDDCRGTLMGIEGAAGRAYWSGVRALLADRVEFAGREHRGASNPVNAMLNYGYAILYSQVWGAVLNAGLEPFAGFLHVDRPGKPSLVLDLTEEFRQPIVDRVVMAHVNLGESIKMRDGFLEPETRQRLAQKILDRFLSAERYRGAKYQVRSVIQMQARRIASFLRGGPDYRTYAFKW
jgi:CRISP-associated protein Cas1